MKYYKDVLENGLRVITVPMPSMESATVTVWVGVGARYETRPMGGISHFLEHMVFKGGRKYRTPAAVSEAIDNIGAGNNAATSEEYTYYYVKASTKHMDRAMDVLSDTVLTPHLSKKDLDTERGVILQEISRAEDDPKRYIWDVFFDVYYGDTPFGRGVLGDRKNVKSITREQMRGYHDEHYKARNMLVSVAGGVDRKEILELINGYFGELGSGEESKFEPFKKETDVRVKVRNEKREQANIMVGFRGNKYGEKTRYAEALLDAILSGGMSSRLFTEVREKRGLCYSVFSSSDSYRDNGLYVGYVGTSPGKAEEAIRVMMNEFYKLSTKKHGITKKEFRKAKEYIKGHMALGLESTSAVGRFFAFEELMTGKMRSVDEVYEKIEKTTIDEVLDVARKIFVPSRAKLAIIGPFKEEKKFEKFLN